MPAAIAPLLLLLLEAAPATGGALAVGPFVTAPAVGPLAIGAKVGADIGEVVKAMGSEVGLKVPTLKVLTCNLNINYR